MSAADVKRNELIESLYNEKLFAKSSTKCYKYCENKPKFAIKLTYRCFKPNLEFEHQTFR